MMLLETSPPCDEQRQHLTHHVIYAYEFGSQNNTFVEMVSS